MSKHKVKLAKKLTGKRSKVLAARKPGKSAGKLPPRVGGKFVARTKPTAPVSAPKTKTKTGSKAKKSKAPMAASTAPDVAPAAIAAPTTEERTRKIKHKSGRAARERRCRAYSMKESNSSGMVRPIHLFAYEAKKLSDILDKRVPDLVNAVGQTYSPDPQKDAVYADAVQTALATRTG